MKGPFHHQNIQTSSIPFNSAQHPCSAVLLLPACLPGKVAGCLFQELHLLTRLLMFPDGLEAWRRVYHHIKCHCCAMSWSRHLESCCRVHKENMRDSGTVAGRSLCNREGQGDCRESEGKDRTCCREDCRRPQDSCRQVHHSDLYITVAMGLALPCKQSSCSRSRVCTS